RRPHPPRLADAAPRGPRPSRRPRLRRGLALTRPRRPGSERPRHAAGALVLPAGPTNGVGEVYREERAAVGRRSPSTLRVSLPRELPTSRFALHTPARAAALGGRGARARAGAGRARPGADGPVRA